MLIAAAFLFTTTYAFANCVPIVHISQLDDSAYVVVERDATVGNALAYVDISDTRVFACAAPGRDNCCRPANIATTHEFFCPIPLRNSAGLTRFVAVLEGPVAINPGKALVCEQGAYKELF